MVPPGAIGLGCVSGSEVIVLGSDALWGGVGGLGIGASLQPITVSRRRVGIFLPGPAPHGVADTCFLLCNAYRLVSTVVASHMLGYFSLNGDDN